MPGPRDSSDDKVTSESPGQCDGTGLTLATVAGDSDQLVRVDGSTSFVPHLVMRALTVGDATGLLF